MTCPNLKEAYSTLKPIGMGPQQYLSSLNAALKVNAVLATRAVIAADHEGFHHSAFDWWLFDARMTSPKTCPVCKALNLRDYRGDWIPARFPYHKHMRVNAIKANVHQHCRCVLRWAGRAKAIYMSPFGLLSPTEVSQVWKPTPEELKRLTPSQIKFIFQFLRSPLRG